MQLDSSDCIREPVDSWQGEVAETSMPIKDILISNCGPNVGIGLGDVGDRWIMYYDRGFPDRGRSCFEHEHTVDEWCFLYEE